MLLIHKHTMCNIVERISKKQIMFDSLFNRGYLSFLDKLL